MSAPRPIGYWLKHLDDLLERQFEAALDDLGVSRRQWQVLHTLDGGVTGRGGLDRALAPFWTGGGGPDLDEVLDRLAVRGWIRTGDGLSLTDTGRAAHAGIRARVEATRATVLDGLTPEQYTETVRVLAVMAGNVEAALAARSPVLPGEYT